ncbi:MAG: S-layer homology domain-containing protein [Clostridiales bacterium]|nr:S-layer homology domain-containing protein [Clostridiales bacterium]
MKKNILAVMLAAGMAFTSLPAVYADDTAPALTDGELPPDLPEGETMGETPGGGMGEMPSGETPNGERGDMPEGEPGEIPEGEAPSGESGGEQTSALPFTDVASTSWYYSYIQQAYSLGLISGVSDTSFQPDGTVTAAQLLSILYRADGNSSDTSSSGNWYDSAVTWAKENSIILDDSNSNGTNNANGWTFSAESNLTREQVIVIIYRYMLYKGIDVSAEGDLSAFTDSGNVSAYAEEAIAALVSKGVISGDDAGTLRPGSTLTRAEVSVILIIAIGGSVQPSGTAQEQPEGMGEKPYGESPEGGMPGSSFGGSGEITQGTAATTIDEDGDYSDETYTSTGDDENALRIDGATVTLDDITVSKSAGSTSNTEDGDFYGMNAALLATNGAQVTITDSEINSSAQNGNGVFSYGEGTVVKISDSTITTTADNSGGIQTTGGGTTYAYDLTVNTSGSSAAAIRSDRGGGTVVVDGGTYTSNGYNSPAVYSTADITVSDADLTANNSEALVIEGQNSIKLNDCDVSGNMSDTKGTSSDENVHNVMIYQSMSGDAEVGTSVFTMEGGSLTSNNGDVFYVTNTHTLVTLSDVEIINEDSEGVLFRITGNSASRGWGTAGANGAQAELTAENQTLEGDIVVDTISTLDFDLTDGSVLTGTINIIDNEQGGTAVSDNAVVTIDSDSVWNLTGDCVISELTNKGTINFNGYTITLADGTVLSE